MNKFKLDPDLIGRTAAPPRQDALAAAVETAGFAPPDPAAQRVAQQEDAIFRASGYERLREDWRQQEDAQWDGFDPDQDVGDSYAGAMAEEIDRSLEALAKKAPSVAAGEGLLRDAGEAAEAGKRQALLRERGARMSGARASLRRRTDELQAQAERAPEQLPALLAQADRLLGEHRALLAGRDAVPLRRAMHETLARRAIAGALAIDPQSAAGKLPGRAVLARAELEAWDAVARSMAEVRAEQDALETRRRFAADARSVRESGEPLLELPDWIVEYSGGATGQVGPRLKEAEALAERQVKARDAALQAYREFQSGKFADYTTDIAALDRDGDDSEDEDDFSDDATAGDESWWRGAQEGASHLKHLRRQHARRLLADPAAVAFEHAPITSAFDGGDVESAVAQAMALQKRMGVTAAQPLPRAHAEALAQRLVESPTEELPALLGTLRRVGERNFPALLAQLARVGLPPSLALAAALEGQAQRLLLQAHHAVGGAASAGAALTGGAAASGRPDAETVEQARAGLAETRLGRLLHAGAERHGRNEPAWDLAYRAAEAAVVQLGVHLARREGEAGAQRAGRLLFGPLDDDRKALDGVASALGAPTEGRAALHRVAGGRATPVAPEAAADFAGTDSAVTDEAETPAAPVPDADPNLVQNNVGGDVEEDGTTASPADESMVVDGPQSPETDPVEDDIADEDDDTDIFQDDGTVDPKKAWEDLNDDDLVRLGFDDELIALIRKAKTATAETLAQVLQEIQAWTEGARAGLSDEELDQFRHLTAPINASLRQLARAAAAGQSIEQALGEARVHAHPISRIHRVDRDDAGLMMLAGLLPGIRGSIRVKPSSLRAMGWWRRRQYFKAEPLAKGADRDVAAQDRFHKVALEKIPEQWGNGRPNAKKVGRRWVDPNDKHGKDGLRIDKGNPTSELPSQREDHVVITRNGQKVDRNGNLVPKSEQALRPESWHIPLSEWRKWSKWDQL